MHHKNKKVDMLFDNLLGTLCDNLLGNLFTGKRVKVKIPERRVMRAGSH